MITVKNLSLTLNQQKILNDISCKILEHKITTFIGKSGAGKTTLLKALVGLYPITKNTVFIQDQDGTEFSDQKRCQKIGFVFQNFNLFAHMTVLENCIDPLLIQKKSLQQAQSIAQEKLKLVGMFDFADSYPSQISGGQQQRVAIARALCLNPEVLLLDEPTASLDPINTQALVDILKKLVDQGVTIVTSSQDMSFVSKIFDQVYFMQNGKIIEYCNTIADIENTKEIKNFLKS